MPIRAVLVLWLVQYRISRKGLMHALTTCTFPGISYQVYYLCYYC
jgi:hypothetical protein